MAATPLAQQIQLFYTGNGSDKFFTVFLVQAPGGDGSQWLVNTQNGARGAAGQARTKTPKPVAFDEARKIFEATAKSKINDGYTTDLSGVPFTRCVMPGPDAAAVVDAPDLSRAREHTGLHAQLLVDIVDPKDAEAILDEPGMRWIFQEKEDGERCMIRKDGTSVIGTNREGLVSPLPPSTIAAINKIPVDYLELDGERLADGRVALFDVMTVNGQDIRHKGFGERHLILRGLLFAAVSPLLKEVRTAFGGEAGRLLFEQVKREQGEGIVAKLRDAPYTPGRSSSLKNAPQVKIKDRVPGLAFVVGHKAGKRSVEMGVLEKDGTTRKIGFITVPANLPIPEIDTVLAIRYRFAYPGGGLCEPVLTGVRPLESKSACLASALRMQRARPSLIDHNAMKDVLESIGYDIDEDSDQPGKWVWSAPSDGCDTSFPSEAAAIGDAWRDASRQAKAIHSDDGMSDDTWNALSFEEQSRKIAALAEDADAPADAPR